MILKHKALIRQVQETGTCPLYILHPDTLWLYLDAQRNSWGEYVVMYNISLLLVNLPQQVGLGHLDFKQHTRPTLRYLRGILRDANISAITRTS